MTPRAFALGLLLIALVAIYFCGCEGKVGLDITSTPTGQAQTPQRPADPPQPQLPQGTVVGTYGLPGGYQERVFRFHDPDHHVVCYARGRDQDKTTAMMLAASGTKDGVWP